MTKDHPLLEALMRDITVLEGSPRPPSSASRQRFIAAACALDLGEELFALIRNVGAVAQGFADAGHGAIAQILSDTIAPLLDRLRAIAEHDVAAEQDRAGQLRRKDIRSRGTSAALAPSTQVGATLRKGR